MTRINLSKKGREDSQQQHPEGPEGSVHWPQSAGPDAPEDSGSPTPDADLDRLVTLGEASGLLGGSPSERAVRNRVRDGRIPHTRQERSGRIVVVARLGDVLEAFPKARLADPLERPDAPDLPAPDRPEVPDPQAQANTQTVPAKRQAPDAPDRPDPLRSQTSGPSGPRTPARTPSSGGEVALADRIVSGVSQAVGQAVEPLVHEGARARETSQQLIALRDREQSRELVVVREKLEAAEAEVQAGKSKLRGVALLALAGVAGACVWGWTSTAEARAAERLAGQEEQRAVGAENRAAGLAGDLDATRSELLESERATVAAQGETAEAREAAAAAAQETAQERASRLQAEATASELARRLEDDGRRMKAVGEAVGRVLGGGQR